MEQASKCKCGCGGTVRKARGGAYNAFIVGHNPKHTKANQPSNSGHSGQFRPGNKFGTGRKEGSRNHVTIAAQNLLQGESEALSRKLVELALDGNIACLKTAIERIIPAVKSRSVVLPDMPKIETIADASKLTAYVLDVVSEGKITPVEGEILSRSAERHMKALEINEIEKRLADLEKRMLEKQS